MVRSSHTFRPAVLSQQNGTNLQRSQNKHCVCIQFIKSLGLEPDTEAVEVLKYQNAVNFWLASAKDGAAVDLAYDGVILQRDMQLEALVPTLMIVEPIASEG